MNYKKFRYRVRNICNSNLSIKLNMTIDILELLDSAWKISFAHIAAISINKNSDFIRIKSKDGSVFKYIKIMVYEKK